jgi:hypothetical protein
MRYTIEYTDKDEEGNKLYDYRTNLLIKVDDKETGRYSSGGEPEDNSFGRDYHWIKKELERAYTLGLEHGKETK